jgi:DNA (cytosine-5)-methyltransferase 1
MRELRACDYGAPTVRKRLFIVARCDGRPIVWPEPTHGPRRPAPYRTAAECIDWSIPCPSIFDRARPLADATLRRIARGMFKYVLGAGEPFIVPVTHPRDTRVHAIGEPLRTITAGTRGEHALVAPTLIQTGRGERTGQAPRSLDLQAPLGTVCAGGSKHALVSAFLARHYGDRAGGFAGALPLTGPAGTVTVRDHHAVVTSSLLKLYGTSTGAPLEEPMPTVTAGGWHLGEVRAFLLAYYGTEQRAGLRDPLPTITTHDRFALVTVAGQEYVIADIGMRMLAPHELAAAQGFPAGYELAPVVEGKPLSKTSQIRMIGNSVSPDVAEAIARAQFVEGAAAATGQLGLAGVA